MIDMLRTLAIVLLFVMTTVASTAQSRSSDSPRWYWFQDCADQSAMGIEVTVDGESVLKSTFPICKLSTPPAHGRNGKQKTLAFTFKGGRTFQGEYQTTNDESIEGNIWQAGADSADLLLGVSLVGTKPNQVLLNTVQIVRPDRRSVEEVATGILVKTFPIRAR